MTSSEGGPNPDGGPGSERGPKPGGSPSPGDGPGLGDGPKPGDGPGAGGGADDGPGAGGGADDGPGAGGGTEPEAGAERRTYTPDFLTELFRNPLDPGYADAAARKARGEGPTGTRKRVLTAITAVTLVALGFLLVIAYQQTVADQPEATKARDQLIQQVQSTRADTDHLQTQADQLSDEVAQLRESELGGAAVAQLRDLEAETGLAPVHGSGAKVTIGDGPTPINPVTGNRSTEAQVRDSDLQLATNALWAAGAEAIAVNGQRLTATSTIRQAGEAILVDFQPVTTPYTILAIGPDKLSDDFRDGVAGKFFGELVARYGMSFETASDDNITLDAATELKLRVAVPATPSLTGSASGGPASAGSAPAGGSVSPTGSDSSSSPPPAENKSFPSTTSPSKGG
jgi:uncharacterized protein YlxW (UPF0749 family)